MAIGEKDLLDCPEAPEGPASSGDFVLIRHGPDDFFGRTAKNEHVRHMKYGPGPSIERGRGRERVSCGKERRRMAPVTSGPGPISPRWQGRRPTIPINFFRWQHLSVAEGRPFCRSRNHAARRNGSRQGLGNFASSAPAFNAGAGQQGQPTGAPPMRAGPAICRWWTRVQIRLGVTRMQKTAFAGAGLPCGENLRPERYFFREKAGR